MESLKCEVCGEPAVGVASSIMPISHAYCRKCLTENAEPIFIFRYHYDEVSTDGEGLAPWFTENVKSYMDGKYITWQEYVEWRHETGQAKSQPYEPSDEEIRAWEKLVDDDDIGTLVPNAPEEEASGFGCD